MLLLGVLLWLHRHTLRTLSRHGVIWTVVALLWLLDAFVAAYILKSPSLLMMQPARATDLWICFGATAIVAICGLMVESYKQDIKRKLAVVALGASFLIWRPLGSPVAAICLLVILLPPVWRRVMLLGSPRRVALLLLVWACLAGGESFRARRAEAGSVSDALVHGPEASVRQVAAWARANTSVDAVFLVNLGVDPDWDQFRGLSERSIVTNWEEGTAMNWDRSFATEWVRRLGILGFDLTRRPKRLWELELDDLFKGLRDRDVDSLKLRLPIDFWVIPVEHASAFPVVFQNVEYKVVDVRRKETG